jgi:hypothetical protein
MKSLLINYSRQTKKLKLLFLERIIKLQFEYYFKKIKQGCIVGIINFIEKLKIIDFSSNQSLFCADV